MDWISLALVILGFATAALLVYNIRLRMKDRKRDRAVCERAKDVQAETREIFRRSQLSCERSALAVIAKKNELANNHASH